MNFIFHTLNNVDRKNGLLFKDIWLRFLKCSMSVPLLHFSETRLKLGSLFRKSEWQRRHASIHTESFRLTAFFWVCQNRTGSHIFLWDFSPLCLSLKSCYSLFLECHSLPSCIFSSLHAFKIQLKCHAHHEAFSYSLPSHSPPLPHWKEPPRSMASLIPF